MHTRWAWLPTTHLHCPTDYIHHNRMPTALNHPRPPISVQQTDLQQCHTRSP